MDIGGDGKTCSACGEFKKTFFLPQVLIIKNLVFSPSFVSEANFTWIDLVVPEIAPRMATIHDDQTMDIFEFRFVFGIVQGVPNQVGHFFVDQISGIGISAAVDTYNGFVAAIGFIAPKLRGCFDGGTMAAVEQKTDIASTGLFKWAKGPLIWSLMLV